MDNLFDALFKKQDVEKIRQQFFDIFKYWPELIVALNDEKKIIYGNIRFFKFTRYEENELLGQSLSKLFKEEDLERLYDIEKPDEICRSLLMKVKGKGEMYVDANHWAIKYSKPLHIYLFRYKHKIREIQRSLELANVGFIEIDEKGIIIDANSAILRLLELDGIYSNASELKKKKIENIVGPGYGEECANKVKSVFGKDKSVYMECIIKTIRGTEEKMFSINAIPDYNLEFKKDVVKIIATDLTDLKNTEKKLQSKSKMYQTLISVAPIGIALIDSKGKFIECNTYLTTIMGAPSAEEFLEKTIYDFASLQEVGLTTEIRGVLEKGEPAIGEKEYVSQYGKKVSLSYAFVPVKENGKFSAFGILEDRSRMTR